MSGSTTVFVYHREQRVGLRQLCRLSGLSAALAAELVDEGLIEPLNPDASPLHWRFPVATVERARIAGQLCRDLGLNLAGAALAVDLLEQMRSMEARMRRLERQLLETL